MANDFEFIIGCKTLEGKHFKGLDKKRPLNRFIIETKAGNIEAAALGTSEIKRLSLSAKWNSIDIIYSTRGQAKSPLVRTRPVWKRLTPAEEDLLQSWLTADNGLESIVNASDFIRELKLLIPMLESGRNLGFKRQWVKGFWR